MPVGPHAISNHLLRRLSTEDLALLGSELEPFDYHRGEFFFYSNQPVSHAYFPDSGICSLVAVSPERQRVEAGIVGREGFAPVALALGADRLPYDGNVQMPAIGHRVPAEVFARAIEASASLRGLMLRYAQAFSVQLGYTALSNAVHPIDERLARWLLMCHDRSVSDELPLTHEFMSIMLAVRRPSVTTSLHVLEGNGLIRSERGCVTIRDRAGLERFAGDAYGTPEAEYRRLLGEI